MSVHPRLLIAVLLLASSTAEAQVARPQLEWDAWGRPLEMVGWTADSRFFVFKRRVEYYPIETIEDEDAVPLDYQFGVVREPRSGREKRYVLELTLEGKPTMRQELSAAPGPDVWEKWLKKHPVLLEPGFRHEDRAELIVSAEQGGQPVPTTKDGDGVRFDMKGQKALKLGLSVRVDGRDYPLHEQREKKGPLAGKVTAFFSPDGLRVAVYVQFSTDQGNGPTDYVMVAPAGPRVEVVVARSERQVAGNAYAHLEAAGMTPIVLHYNERIGDKTRIRVSPGFEAEAQRLADALAGEVVVEPFAKPSKYDLSIVAGPELLQPVAQMTDLLDDTPPIYGRIIEPVHGNPRRGFAWAFTAVGVCLVALLILRLRARRRRV